MRRFVLPAVGVCLVFSFIKLIQASCPGADYSRSIETFDQCLEHSNCRLTGEEYAEYKWAKKTTHRYKACKARKS